MKMLLLIFTLLPLSALAHGLEPDLQQMTKDELRQYQKEIEFDAQRLQHHVEQNVPWALSFMGHLYSLGLSGLPEDECTSIALFDQAARLGDPMGQAAMAYHYDYGDGVKKSAFLACAWAKSAKNSGYTRRDLSPLINHCMPALSQAQIDELSHFRAEEQAPAKIIDFPNFDILNALTEDFLAGRSCKW